MSSNSKKSRSRVNSPAALYNLDLVIVLSGG